MNQLQRTRRPVGVSLIEVRSGKIAKTTEVFGAPSDPPAWRARWVERMT